MYDTISELINFSVGNIEIFYLLLLFVSFEVLFQLKHWVCDYPLQTEYMLEKAKANWFLPLFSHSGVHALGTFILVFWGLTSFGVEHKVSLQLSLILGICDLVFHFIVDYFKAQPLNKWTPNNKLFWWLLGLDQLFHHLFNIIYTLIIVLTILRF